ncbi:hypothetical protein AWJ20_4904 [Sugiyamaella lignohabitans]|uniref:FAM50A/XAP5 C-terminal domain-containing protein n=1 Tax=Sugiyamaella lignohabitans TaxID=796027 RepID=A0A167EDW4_9ASCO|nr:uncharacterized protein AWJ20_4904 [Sugiyamaella lignohabitans]ANB13951.1 hypothetical protein AWJ20_4904 [Sugiyamaella lignohabitans]
MESNGGLVSLKELRRRKEEAKRLAAGGVNVPTEEIKPAEEATNSQDRSTSSPAASTDSGERKRELTSDNSTITTTKSRFKKRKQVFSKLSFANDEDEEDDNERDNGPSRPVSKLKRDPTIDTSNLKTKKQILKDRELLNKEKNSEAQKHAIIREQVVNFPFVYYDGSETASFVEIKKGDPVWMILEKTRKGFKKFHRGTVDDIMLVKHNVIIPHVSPPPLLLHHTSIYSLNLFY